MASLDRRCAACDLKRLFTKSDRIIVIKWPTEYTHSGFYVMLKISEVSNNPPPYFNEKKEDPLLLLEIDQVVSNIFSFINYSTLVKCRLVNKKWNRLSKETALWINFSTSLGFSERHWNKYLGIVEKVPFPKDLISLLSTKCPVFKNGRTIGDTHKLFLVPKKVNGKPLTLKGLGELVKTPKFGHPCQYRWLCNTLPDLCTIEVDDSQWVLMTKDVIGKKNLSKGSRNKSYEEQVQLIKEIATASGLPYQVPSALHVAACLFLHYVETGVRLFGEDSDGPLDYTRCLEKNRDGLPISVGGFFPTGFNVCYGRDHPNNGIAACIVFKNSALSQ